MPTILTHILMIKKDKEVTTTWHLFRKKCINCQATNQPLPKTPTTSFSSVSWSRLGHSMSTQPISAAVPAGVSKRLGVWLLSNSCEHPISQVHQKGTGRNYRAKCKWYQVEANMTWDEPWNLTWQRPVVRCRRSSSRFFLHLWCCGILSCDSLSSYVLNTWKSFFRFCNHMLRGIDTRITADCPKATLGNEKQQGKQARKQPRVALPAQNDSEKSRAQSPHQASHSRVCIDMKPCSFQTLCVDLCFPWPQTKVQTEKHWHHTPPSQEGLLEVWGPLMDLLWSINIWIYTHIIYINTLIFGKFLRSLGSSPGHNGW